LFFSAAAALPELRARMATDMKRDGLPREKVLATIVSLLEKTSYSALPTRMNAGRRVAHVSQAFFRDRCGDLGRSRASPANNGSCRSRTDASPRLQSDARKFPGMNL
jgi:hypothetical protein